MSTKTVPFTRGWRYDGYEDGIEESLILVNGESIGGAYYCAYNPAHTAGWGHNDGELTGESWASWGPRGLSCGHPTREAAEEAQLQEYATDPELYDRLRAIESAENEAEQERREADYEAVIAVIEDEERSKRPGDDEPGPTIWMLPAYHVLYASLDEVNAVCEWFAGNDIHDVAATCAVRVEQRSARKVIVYESPTSGAALLHALGAGRSMTTVTRVVTLRTEPPEITTPDRPELHTLLEKHWPSRFPLVDFGQTMACGSCTRDVPGMDLVPWPCPAIRAAT